MSDLSPGETRTRLYRMILQRQDDGSYAVSVTDVVQYLHPVSGEMVSEETLPRPESLAQLAQVLADVMPDILLSNLAHTDEIALLRAERDAALQERAAFQMKAEALVAERDQQILAANAVIEEQARRMQAGSAVPVEDFGYAFPNDEPEEDEDEGAEGTEV